MKRIIPFVLALLLLSLPIAALAKNHSNVYEGDITPEQAAGLGIGCFIAIIIFVIVCLVVEILIIVWVYKDAKARNMENPALWIILIIFTGIIGLIVYLVVRPKDKVIAPPPSGGTTPPPTA